MKSPPVLCLFAVACCAAFGQSTTSDVGTGAPTDAIRRSFLAAYFRNTFYVQLSLPPIANVKKFGSTGLIQEFNDAAKDSGVKLALVKANINTQPADGSDVFQVFAAMYAYYQVVTQSTAGYPTMDTGTCPDQTCQYQFFDKPSALFTYIAGVNSGQSFFAIDPFYTKWVGLGGINGMGGATSAATASLVSGVASASIATIQTFEQGAIFNITAGLLVGKLVAVKEPIYDLYTQNGGYSGSLGFPTNDEVTLSSGSHQQTFEGGTIQYAPGGSPVILFPVGALSITAGGSTVQMNLGDTLNVQATAYSATGQQLIGRAITFVSTNSHVVSIQSNGPSATLTAVGGGTARITAVSEGKVSPAITFFVKAPCCQIGEGAPTAAMTQLFQDAVTRNRLVVKTPVATPVRRVGAGYVQDLQPADPASTVRYLVAISDRTPAAYVVTGGILAEYNQLGGPSGSLGYPTSDPVYDAALTGRQLFQNGAIAGIPPLVVTAPILQKWSLQGYEAGPAGQPTAGLDTFVTFSGTPGESQAFKNGAMYFATSGAQINKVYFVTGLVLAQYTTLSGPRGQLGLPTTDESLVSGLHHQDFEGGYLEYTPGDTQAKLTIHARTPSITAAPSAVLAGTRVRVVVGGFANGATIRVSLTGQPDFLVPTTTGSYFWDLFVPSNASPGPVTVRAVDTANSAATAQGGYTIQSSANLQAQLVKLSGDVQTGVPGALLPQPLVIAVRDPNGNPLPAIAVQFAASPGAQVSATSAVTDSTGQATVQLRLPSSEGISLATASAAGQVATFSAKSTQVSLVNYPKLVQSGTATIGSGTASVAQKGSMLTAVAAIIRYYQQRGDVPMPNGLGDPGILNTFLSKDCNFDTQGNQICDGFISPTQSKEQFVNLWRLTDFAGGALDVSPETPDPAVMRDFIAQGTPVLLALALTANNVSAGAHFVVAIGVGSDGSILIHDPNPAFNRAALSEYLNGFAAGGVQWKGTLTGAARLLPRTPSPTGFLVLTSNPGTSNASLAINSQAGACGVTLAYPDVIAAGDGSSLPGATILQRYCDGTQPAYQIDLTGAGVFAGSVTDLGPLGSKFDLSGSGQSSFKANRPTGQLAVTAQDLSFASSGVVNAATFTDDVAPGGLISIFGSGLAKAGGTTSVQINGVPSQVLLALPFQVNAVVPLDLPPGNQVLRIVSPFGTADQQIGIQSLAPQIFRLAPTLLRLPSSDTTRGAILNQDGTINQPANPARRGAIVVIFGTGFGAVSSGQPLSTTVVPVTAKFGSRAAPASFAGLAPGFVGLYQVNVAVPADLPPDLAVSLSIQQGNVVSAPVEISIQ
jgi:uncharacterized protein (TIGR03437 family)